MNNEVKFVPSYKAYERASGIPGLAKFDIKDSKWGDLQKKIKFYAETPTNIFIMYIRAISFRLKNKKIISIPETDINFLISIVRNNIKEDKIKHLNPVGFILGYLATNRGKKLDKERLKKMIKDVLPLVLDGSVEPADLVRYARYWEKLMK